MFYIIGLPALAHSWSSLVGSMIMDDVTIWKIGLILNLEITDNMNKFGNLRSLNIIWVYKKEFIIFEYRLY